MQKGHQLISVRTAVSGLLAQLTTTDYFRIAMQKRMTRKSILTYTMMAWVIGCGFYAYYYVSSILSLPDLSQGYEQDWSFQLLMFFIFRFPLLLIVLIVIMVVEVMATKNTKTM